MHDSGNAAELLWEDTRGQIGEANSWSNEIYLWGVSLDWLCQTVAG